VVDGGAPEECAEPGLLGGGGRDAELWASLLTFGSGVDGELGSRGPCRGGRTRGWMIYGEAREYGWKGAEAGCLVFREGLAVTAGALNSSVGRELNKYER
jgi:hypothetical protein